VLLTNPAQQIVAPDAQPDVFARFMADGGAMLVQTDRRTIAKTDQEHS
jgi:hypothetical protein